MAACTRPEDRLPTRRETNWLVEEFMLLANISVAEKIYELFPDCACLRKHPAPPISNFDPLVKAAETKVCDAPLRTARARACLCQGLSTASKHRQRAGRLARSSGSTCSSVLQHDASHARHTLHDASRVLLQWLRVRHEEFRALRSRNTHLHSLHLAHSTVQTRSLP